MLFRSHSLVDVLLCAQADLVDLELLPDQAYIASESLEQVDQILELDGVDP